MFSRFYSPHNTIHEHYGQTDRWTDRQTLHDIAGRPYAQYRAAKKARDTFMAHSMVQLDTL